MAENTEYILRCIECETDYFIEGERDFYNSMNLAAILEDPFKKHFIYSWGQKG